MSNPANEQTPSPVVQIAYLDDTLKLVKEILEVSSWSQEVYDRVMDLIGEMRGTVIAIIHNPTATGDQRQQAQRALKEASRLATAANKRHRQYAFAFLKQQRAREKRHRSDD
jgi:hypothetical protein